MPKVISELPPDMEDFLPVFMEEWVGVNTATAPADRPRAEAAITALYKEAGHAPPRFIWGDSPLGVHEAMQDGPTGDEIGNALRKDIGYHAKSRLFLSTDRSNDQWLGKWVRRDLEERMEFFLYDRMGRGFAEDLDSRLFWNLEEKKWKRHVPCLWGQQDAPWIAMCRFFQIIGVVYEGETTQLLHLWEEVARSCFWWWAFAGVCFVSERPSLAILDDDYRFHCPDGPALAFRDGWETHVWRGTVVPREIVMKPVTLETIGGCKNIEHQRIMIDRFGLERYIEDQGGREVARDDLGVLLEFKMAKGRRQYVVKVLNPTPGPDGERRAYLIQLGGRHRTPADAIGSTFGFSPGAYKPTEQA